MEGSAREITMKNDNGKYKTVVKMLLRLENAVRDDIFDYIVNK